MQIIWLRLRSLRPTVAIVLVVGLFTLVAVIDWVTGPELSFSLFYLLPIILVSLRWGIRTGQFAAAGAAVVWFVVDMASGARYDHSLIPLWNATVRFGFFSLVSWLFDSLHRAVERETELARTDPLTGLPNRRAFSEMAARELARSERSVSGLAVAAIDLDGFKGVNDSRGHQGGDEVLRRFALVASRGLRAVDITARTGGDEFAVLLPDVDAGEADAVLRRFRTALATQGEGGIACSIGVVCVRGGELSDVLRMADDALYRAKEIDKGSIVLIDLTKGSAETSPAEPSGP